MAERSGASASGALARILAREARWLARAPEEPAAAARARHGLDWLSDLASDFGAPDAARWFRALRDRPPAEDAAASFAWRDLGAPACELLAREAARPAYAAAGPAGAFGALRAGALDWGAESERVRAFVEPPPRPASPPAPSPETVAAPSPAPPPLFLAVAAFAQDLEPALTVVPGRVEIAGVRPAAAIAPAELAALDTAARAAGAALDLRVRPDGALAWRVLARADGPAAHVFVAPAAGPSAGAPALAVPYHRALEPALAAGAVVPRLDFGHGARACRLDAGALAGARPAGLGVVGETRAPDGRAVPVVDVVDDAATLAWAGQAQVAQAPAPSAPAAACAEALQPASPPADAMVEAPPGALGRALVADDSLMARVFLARLLAQEGLAVEGAENGLDARAALEGGAFAFAFLDFDMPGGGALELLEGLAPARRPRVCVLVKDEDERQRAVAAGFGPTLLKPFAEDEVLAALAALRAGTSEPNP